MTNAWQISRRTILRGLGAAVTLPLLDAMQPAVSLAATPKMPWLRAPPRWRSSSFPMESIWRTGHRSATATDTICPRFSRRSNA